MTPPVSVRAPRCHIFEMNADLRLFLLDPRNHGGSVSHVQHIETHISEVFLVGDAAYKVKKEIRLPFLDFSTLAARRDMCEREVALNRRYAPVLYDRVIAIGLAEGRFNLTGQGEIIEYAVKMRRFVEDDLWSRQIVSGVLSEDAVVALVRRIAAFHRAAEPRPAWGDFDTIRALIKRNVDEIPREHRHRAFAGLAQLIEAELVRHRALITKRRATHVKAIHGDLHLRNVAFFRGEPLPFDGIEFSEELGSGDVWSDLGFLNMDLAAHRRHDLATCAVNTYLEENDDFEGVPLLALYTAHRALVRAKVHLLSGLDDDDTDAVDRYLDTASDALTRRSLHIIAVAGLSGSGKTTLARALAKRLGALVLRTDVIRKHILGLRPLDVAPESGYTPAISEQVYRGLLDRAHLAAPRGGIIILDGVHRDERERAASEALARALNARFTGLWCVVPKEIALKRVESRSNDASNAHRGVIERQYSAPPSDVRWPKLDTARELPTPLENALRLVREYRCLDRITPESEVAAQRPG